MMNAFFLSGAVLVEVERLVNGMGRYFADVAEYKDGLAPAVHGADFKKVVRRFRDLRRQSAFHFDPKAARDALNKRAADFERFLSSHGTKNKDYYYDLGDTVAFQIVADTFKSEAEFESWARDFLQKAGDVTNRLLYAADNFIGSQVVGRWRAVRRQVREPEPLQ